MKLLERDYMRTKKLSKKMTIVLSMKEAKKKGIDKLTKFAEDKGWVNHRIIFDAVDNAFVYTVTEDDV